MGILKEIAEPALTALGMALGAGGARRAQKEQVRANKELADYSAEKQFEMWNKTNYGAQMEHLKAAGLNAGLMYGMSGGGGATTGSASAGSAGMTATDTASQRGASAMQMGLMLAQKKVLETQAAKNQAEADATSGVKTDLGKEEITAKQFENALNQAIGIDQKAEMFGNEAALKRTASWKELDEYNAWKAAGFEGKASDDRNSPLSKAIRAGLDIKAVELEKARTENNIQKAEQIIREFEANMANEGLHKNSPWYVKFIMDLIDKGAGSVLNKFSTGK